MATRHSGAVGLALLLLVGACSDADTHTNGLQLVVEAPLDGQELGADGADVIEVRGTVASDRPIVVEVDGAVVSVDASGAWQTTLSPRFGHQHIEVTAVDDLGAEQVAHLDVLWADSYLAPSAVPDYAVSAAATLQLDRSALDDTVGVDLTSPTATVTDLADLVQALAERYDHGADFPDPVIDSAPTMTLRMLSPQPGQASSTIALDGDTFDVTVRYPAFVVETDGQVQVDVTAIPLAGQVSADVTVSTTVSVTAPSGGPIVVEVGAPSATVASIEGTFDDPEASAVFDSATDMRAVISDQIAGAAESALTVIATGAFDAGVGSIADGLGDAPPFAGVVTGLASPSHDVLVASMDLEVATGEPAAHPGSRGVAEVALASPAVTGTGVSVRLDAFNTALHALWNAGGLAADVTAQVGPAVPGGGTATASSALPPVVAPAGAADALALSLGGGEVAFGPDTAVGFTAEVPAVATLAGRAVALDLSGPVVVHAWWKRTPDEGPPVDIAAVESALTEAYWPTLRATLEAATSIPILAPRLRDLGGVAADLSGLELELQATGPAVLSGGHVVLGVGLVGAIPE